MPAERSGDTTQLLRACVEGRAGAVEALLPHVYRELRRIAGHHMRNEQVGRSIQATELVHEAYLKLIDSAAVD